MKFRESRTTVKKFPVAAPSEASDTDRRRAVRYLVGGIAAFATSLFVTKRAHAGSCGCDNNCQPTGSECIKSHGLCYDQDLEAYVHLYALRNGSPAAGCCVDPGGFICGYYCSPSPIC
jgi:hypothetical protein